METGFLLRLFSASRDFISVPFSSVSAAQAWATFDQLVLA
jgi:hypothetical protein